MLFVPAVYDIQHQPENQQAILQSALDADSSLPLGKLDTGMEPCGWNNFQYIIYMSFGNGADFDFRYTRFILLCTFPYAGGKSDMGDVSRAHADARHRESDPVVLASKGTWPVEHFFCPDYLRYRRGAGILRLRPAKLH